MVTTHYVGTHYLGLYHWNKKLSGYKMTKAIKSKNFVTWLLCLKAPERKKFEGFSFASIPIKYDGKDCFVNVRGNFKLFEHNNKGKKSYSLGIRSYDDNREWWESLEAEIQKLSIPALKKLAKPEHFVSIKTNKNGYSNVYANVYENSCKFASLVEDGPDSIPLQELISEEWHDRCVLHIKRSFIGTGKTITIIAMRGLIGEIKLSFSDDYSDKDKIISNGYNLGVLNESRELLDVPFSLPNKCAYHVLASSRHSLIPLGFNNVVFFVNSIPVSSLIRVPNVKHLCLSPNVQGNGSIGLR